MGGGGGNGGDSSSIQIATENSSVSIAVAVGGTGGAGGTGGNVTVANDQGYVATFGAGATAVQGQSIGGGGGNGGFGTLDVGVFLTDNPSLTFDLALGGGGGSGNTGGTVTINNTGGSLVTYGDGSRGIFAQSVGGGGGIANLADSAGSGGKITFNIAVGGNGGTGNTGGPVNVTNSGAILTAGGKSDAIFAQSVGGSGGVGGRASTGSGTDPELRVADYIAGGMGFSSDAVNLGNGIYGFVKDEVIGDRAISTMQAALSSYISGNEEVTPPSEPKPDGETSREWTVDVGAAAGGKGGAGGNGGTVTVDNTGQILTLGPNSAGIYAQSVGGSGGVGGTVQPANNPQALSQLPDTVPLSGAIAIGGGGGNSGSGGTVHVTNDGNISTQDVISPGIYAYSVGGGGGEGGGTSAGWQQIKLITFALGGNGGSNGDGGHVTVDYTNSTASITTGGDSAYGIDAQSVGGGGGMATLMIAVPKNGGGTFQSGLPVLPAGFTPTLIPIEIGGKDGEHNCGSTGTKAAGCGNGGEVDVSAVNVTTSGRNGYGIVAQSIGGGGGQLIGMPAFGTSFFNVPMVGNGGTVNVTVGNTNGSAAVIKTTGDGAIGILAQSVGGGGLLAGDMSVQTSNSTTAFTKNTASNGNGGNVTVTIEPGAQVITSGANAHGIFAQSVAGGGGLVAAQDQGVVVGSAGGSGTGGVAQVNVYGSVTATGHNASAVFLNADTADYDNPGLTAAVLNVYKGGSVNGNISAPAVLLVGPNLNVVNGGLISNPGGTAIESRNNGPAIYNNPGGIIVGNLNVPGGVVTNDGVWVTGTSSNLNGGDFYNNADGTIDVLGASSSPYGTSTVIGYVNVSGTVRTTVDFYNRLAGQVVVTGGQGGLDFSGGATFLLTPALLAPNEIQVASGDTLTTGALKVQDAGNLLFQYTPKFVGNALFITPSAELASVALKNSFSAAEQSTAGSLQSGFVTGMSEKTAGTYAQLSTLGTAAAYKSALDSLGNETSQAAGTARLTSSLTFVERMNSCPEFEGEGTELREHECAWSRVDRQHIHRDSNDSGVGYAQDNYTVQFGGQGRHGEDWFLGGSVGYENSDLSGDVAHGVTGDSWMAGLVLKHQIGEWLLSASVDVGRGNYRTWRTIQVSNLVQTATGKFAGDHVGLHVRSARQFAFRTWYLKPYLDLHVTRLHTDGYTETGADQFGLKVSGERDTVFAASPMIESGHRFGLPRGMTLRAFAAVGATVYNRNEWGARANLLEAPAQEQDFRAVSTLPKTIGKINLGVSLLAANNLDVRLEGSFGAADGYRVDTQTLKFNYLF